MLQPFLNLDPTGSAMSAVLAVGMSWCQR